MRMICMLAVLMVSVCPAQTAPPSPAEIDALDAAYRADLRGMEDLNAHSPIQPRVAERPVAGSVSVTQLRHQPNRKAHAAVVRGAKASQSGDHRRAAEWFEKAIEHDPEFANAYDRLGVEYAQLGRYADAEASLQRSLILDDGSWSAHFDLAVVLYRTGDFAGAERSVRRALDLSRSNAQVHQLLGLLLCRNLGTRAEGLEHLKYAARSSPQAAEILTAFQSR